MTGRVSTAPELTPFEALVTFWAIYVGFCLKNGSGETLDALAFRADAALATLHPVAAGLRPEMRLDRDFAEWL